MMAIGRQAIEQTPEDNLINGNLHLFTAVANETIEFQAHNVFSKERNDFSK